MIVFFCDNAIERLFTEIVKNVLVKHLLFVSLSFTVKDCKLYPNKYEYTLIQCLCFDITYIDANVESIFYLGRQINEGLSDRG